MLWPHSPAIAFGPLQQAPSTTMPPPVPVPTITPNTVVRAGGRAIGRFGQRETVGIVGDAHRPIEHALEIGAEADGRSATWSWRS